MCFQLFWWATTLRDLFASFWDRPKTPVTSVTSVTALMAKGIPGNRDADSPVTVVTKSSSEVTEVTEVTPAWLPGNQSNINAVTRVTAVTAIFDRSEEAQLRAEAVNPFLAAVCAEDPEFREQLKLLREANAKVMRTEPRER
jgi:hypothetical protein